MLNCSTFVVAVCRKRGNGGVTPQLLFQILTNVWCAVTQHITGGELNYVLDMVFCIRISSMWCLLWLTTPCLLALEVCFGLYTARLEWSGRLFPNRNAILIGELGSPIGSSDSSIRDSGVPKAVTTQFILDHLYFIKNGLYLRYLRLSRDLWRGRKQYFQC